MGLSLVAGPMKLVVGLGNPGSRYARTRHNAGFLALEALSQRVFKDEAFQLRAVSPWRERFRGLYAEAEVVHAGNVGKPTISSPCAASQKALLLMPQTFMNLSGESVREAAAFYKLGAEDVVVCHDDIDLPFGTVRVRQGGGEGGHNGLRSIGTHMGSKQFFRVRIGVGRPDAKIVAGAATSPIAPDELTDAERHASVSDWVLSSFQRNEEAQLTEILSRTGDAVLMLICQGLAYTQQQFHRAKT